MDISVLSPILLGINLISIEERYPSLEFAINLECTYGSTKLCFQDVIWIEQDVWNSFVSKLVSTRSLSRIGEQTQLKLFDMSDRFRIVIYHHEHIPIFSVSFGRENDPQIMLNLRYQIDDDIYGHISRSFEKLYV